jgi:hypothetical protein
VLTRQRFDTLCGFVRHAEAITVCLAVEQMHTVGGVLATREAERAGRARPIVMRALDRRVAELAGEITPSRSQLVAIAEVH